MKNLKAIIYICITLYLIIGLLLWWAGGASGNAPLPAQVFTFAYVVLAWPFVLGMFIIFN